LATGKKADAYCKRLFNHALHSPSLNETAGIREHVNAACPGAAIAGARDPPVPSPWRERVRVRGSRRCRDPVPPLTPALSRGERGRGARFLDGDPSQARDYRSK